MWKLTAAIFHELLLVYFRCFRNRKQLHQNIPFSFSAVCHLRACLCPNRTFYGVLKHFNLSTKTHISFSKNWTLVMPANESNSPYTTELQVKSRWSKLVLKNPVGFVFTVRLLASDAELVLILLKYDSMKCYCLHCHSTVIIRSVV